MEHRHPQEVVMAKRKSSVTNATGAPPEQSPEARKPGDIELSEKALDEISGGVVAFMPSGGSATIIGGGGPAATVSGGGAPAHHFGKFFPFHSGSATIIGS
jgi:hypothetical protein